MELEQLLPSPIKQDMRTRSEGTLHVSITRRRAGSEPEELRNETIRVMSTEDIKNPAYVGVSPRYTKNLGNYESLQMGIICVLPCEATKEGVEGAFQRASDFAAAEMEKNMKAFIG